MTNEQIFRAQYEGNGAFARVPTLGGPEARAARRSSQVRVTAASQSEDPISAIQAEHPSWSLAQCEREAWETVWT